MKIDTRRVQVTSGGRELVGRRDAERLRTGSHSVRISLRDDPSVQLDVELRDGVATVHDPRGNLVEVFSQGSLPSATHWQREPLFDAAHREYDEVLPGTGAADAARLLHAGAGPARVDEYVWAGATSVGEVLALHRSRVDPDQLRCWRMMDPHVEVRAVRHRHRQGLTPERVAAYGEVLLGRPAGGGVAGRVSSLVGLAADVDRFRDGPGVSALWAGAAPVAPFLHRLGVSPRMLERALDAEASGGHGAYFTRLRDAVAGVDGAKLHLPDYMLLRHTGLAGGEVPFTVDDAALTTQAVRALRRGDTLGDALRSAVEHTGPVATPATALGASLTVNAFVNAHTATTAVWAERVRAADGDGPLWSSVDAQVRRTLRDMACPAVEGRTMAFSAAGEAGVPARGTSAFYLLHPGRCTAACAHLGTDGHVPEVALEGAHHQLLRPGH